MDLDVVLARLAGAQHGVVAHSQLIHAGFSASSIQRRLRTGALRRVHKGIYVAAAAPPTWHQAVLAACAWGGVNKAAASHRCAARLFGLDGVEEAPPEISTTRDLRSPAIVIHRVRYLPPRHLTRIQGIPTTSIARTLLDLAAVVDPVTLGVALDSALRLRLVTLPRLRSWLERDEAAVRGSARLARAIAQRLDHQARLDSAFESRLFGALVQARVPLPITQYVVRDGNDAVARVDFAYPEHRLAIECDGYRYHQGRVVWQRDLERRNRLLLAGWRVIHVTWEQARDVRRIAALINRALQHSLPSA